MVQKSLSTELGNGINSDRKLQQNLAHERQDTTLDYIGTLDADYRAPDDAYGTAWLQAFWERLSRKRRSFQLSSSILQTHSETDSFDAELDEQASPMVKGYVFKIWLEGIRPPIWRRFQVPAGINFRQLHEIVQIVMGGRIFTSIALL